jgi:hypothetical protein
MPTAPRDRGAIGASVVATAVAVLIGGGAAVTTTFVVVSNANESARKGVVPSGQAPAPKLPPASAIVGYSE